MNTFLQLKRKIALKKAKITIVGLGYVGLPLGVEFAKKGYFVYGYETNKRRIKHLYNQEEYISDIDPKVCLNLIKKNKFRPTNSQRVLRDSDVIIICVPTPLRKVKIPDISYIVLAAKTIKKYLRKGQLIILESTSYPTTTREVVLPILNNSGLTEGKDFFLCFSPERVNPGDKEHPFIKIAKIVGGLSGKSGMLSKMLYAKIIKKVVIVSSCEVAESAKLLENTFRLVNIGLVNEFAMVANRLGVSIWEIIEAAKTKPFGFMPFYPGPGIGGHCIPQDPMYLSWKARKLGFKTKMIDLASYVNHFMPKYVVRRTEKLLKKKNISMKKARILIIGVTYKKDVKDLRESPALEIITLLKKKGAKINYYDPLMPYLKVNKLNLKRCSLNRRILRSQHCAIIVTDHSGMDYTFFRKNSGLIFDTRCVYKRNFENVEKL